jgi:hypothetical protein
MGVTQHSLGDLPRARRHLERVLADYVTSDYRNIIRLPLDLWATARAVFARVLWLQGFPDQAMCAAESTIEEARAASHVITLCHALALAACPIALWTGDLAAVEHYARILLGYSTRHALTVWHALGSSHQGALVIRRGDVASGLRLLRAGFDEIGEARSAVGHIPGAE